MSWEIIKRIDTLNNELKTFGFSLDSSIDDVYEKYHKGELQNEKIRRLSLVSAKSYEDILSVYLAGLKKETEHKETNGTYDIIRVTAYDIKSLPITKYDVKKRVFIVGQFQFFLYEQYTKYPPTTTPKENIELCLQAITRGVELAKFIPELEAEIGNIHTSHKRQRIPKNKR